MKNLKQLKSKDLSDIHRKYLKFFALCKGGKILSVLEAAAAVGEDFNKIKKFCKSWAGMGNDVPIMRCRQFCLTSVGRALNGNEITKDQANKYLIENGGQSFGIEYWQKSAKEKDRQEKAWRDMGYEVPGSELSLQHLPAEQIRNG